MTERSAANVISLRFITVWIMALSCLILSASPAFAHKLLIDWRFDDSRLHVEAFYDDNTPAQDARVVLESETQILAEGKTDEKGVWSCPKPAPGSYSIRAESVGHAAKSKLTINASPATVELKATRSDADKTSAMAWEGTGSTDKSANRSETTETPWLRIVIGFAVIAGLCSLWRFAKRA